VRPAYIDTSCLIAIAFQEPGWEDVARRLESFGPLLASNLLEAELRATFAREACEASPDSLLAAISWIHPQRALTAEYERALSRGTIRGADLAHLACALYLAPEPADLAFLTLDVRQGTLAAALGFPAV